MYYVNAYGQLDGWIERIEEGIAEARYRAKQGLPAIELDVVVQAWPECVIDEMGFVGYALVGRYLENHAGESATSLAHEPAESLLAYLVA